MASEQEQREARHADGHNVYGDDGGYTGYHHDTDQHGE